MMTQLTTEIQDAIKKNLPQVIGEELQTILTTLNADKAHLCYELAEANNKLEAFKIEVKSINQQLANALAKLADHGSLDEKLKQLEAAKADLEKRELNIIRETAMNRAVVAEAKAETALSMFNTVFRNTQLRNSVLGDVVVPVEGQTASQYNPCSLPGHVERHSVVTNTTTEEG